MTVGALLYWRAPWFGRVFSYRADKAERDEVWRHSPRGPKVWKEDDPEKFATRIDEDRFVAALARWLMTILGAIFAIGGAIELIELLVK